VNNSTKYTVLALIVLRAHMTYVWLAKDKKKKKNKEVNKEENKEVEN